MKLTAVGTNASLVFMLALAACGGDGGAPPPEGPATLAYAVSECREGKDGAVGQQSLHIRDGDREVTVMESGPFSSPTSDGLCRAFGLGRNGAESTRAWPIQRLGVSSDGSTVVFEVTDDFSLLSLSQVPPEQEGIWVVHADGSGLRRVTAASRYPSSPFDTLLTLGLGLPYLGFSPDGRTVAFTDLDLEAPDPAEPQMVTLDLLTGQRRQLTHMPPGVPSFPSFMDARTILFSSTADPDGTNPGHVRTQFTVTTDSPPQLKPLPVIALPGGEIIPDLRITAAEASARGVAIPGRTPVNCCGTQVQEAFVFSPSEVLQLTNFRRSDTGYARLTTDRQRVVFIASADPVGENPNNYCELFSIDRFGADLRQLTHMGAGPRFNCEDFDPLGRGCTTQLLRVDPLTGWVTFYSSCDPFGTNPLGGQLFTIRPDGSGLRQLTSTSGMTTDSDGTVHVELPGPWAAPSRGGF